MDSNEIAAAFNQQNDKRNWKARALGTTRKDSPAQLVNFSSTAGMVALEYDCETGKFAVKFNKFTGAWGDYIKAIARSLHVVLNTLKSAGLPFEAPPTLAGIVVEAVTTDDNTVHVRWQGETLIWGQPKHVAPVFNADLVDMGEPPALCPITEATMPELRAKFTPPQEFSPPAGYREPLYDEGGNCIEVTDPNGYVPDEPAYVTCLTCDMLGYACAQHDPNQARLPDIL